MLDDEHIADLADDIRANGLRVPIVLCDGAIIDGRNRYRACTMAGAEPRWSDLPADANPFDYVISLNIRRRDLTPTQRAAIYIMARRAGGEWERERERRTGAANAKRSKATKERPREADGTMAPGTSALSRDNRLVEPKTHDKVAAATGTSAATAARVQAIANAKPELLQAMAAGELTATQAGREMRRAELTASHAALPEGKYRVVYADPPWQYNDSRAGLDDYEASAAEAQYPTMSTADICALDVKSLAADDSVLLCWATFPLLPDALEVVRAWGFKYKTAIVWDKVRPNMGHYHNASAELLLICTRGSGTPDESKRADQVQVVERTGRHSEKPEHFRKLIDSLWTAGPRVELFRRGKAPDGWKVWGNESE